MKEEWLVGPAAGLAQVDDRAPAAGPALAVGSPALVVDPGPTVESRPGLEPSVGQQLAAGKGKRLERHWLLDRSRRPLELHPSLAWLECPPRWDLACWQ